MRSSAHRPSHATRRGGRTLGVVSAALSVLAFVCLSAAAAWEAPTVSMAELADRDSRLLMSCEGDDLPSSEPAWCSNPDSPHCLPALPEPERSQLAHGPVAVVWSAVVAPAAARRDVTLLTWPAIEAEHARSLQRMQPLERPPRSV